MVPSVKDENLPGFASHVRVGWAQVVGEQPGKVELTIPSLMSPKPSHGPFYLGGTEWSPNAQIAGRKTYWHGAHADAYGDIRDTVKCLAPGTELVARVRFDNLTQAEVGLLAAAIDPKVLGEPFHNSHHKFGLGKPVGLGTIATQISQFTLIDRATRYRSIDDHPKVCEIDQFAAAAQQWLMTSFDRQTLDQVDHLYEFALLLDPATVEERTVRTPGGHEWFGDRPLEQVARPDQVAAGQGQTITAAH